MNDDATALMAQAITLHRQGALPAAEALYRRILAQTPRHADALHLLGVLTAQGGRPVEAIALITAAIAEAPDAAPFHANLGRAYKAAGRPADALARFDHAAALGSTDPGIFNDRGNVLLDLGRADAALDSFDRALALRPAYAEALANRGNALRALGRAGDALDSLDQALALRPDFADALSNRGNVLRDLDRQAQALESYDRAIALRPDHADALANRGITLRALGRLDAALASYDRALALQPDHVIARNSRSLCLLHLGDWTRGWAEHEWHWRMPDMAERARRFTHPPWLGDEKLAGKTILLHAEQGYGDTLQFCRYSALVAALGARVVLEAPWPLARLLASLDGVVKMVPRGDPLPPFDQHCPLMSLPLAFGTTLATVPAPAQVRVAPERIDAWRQRLAGVPGLRVGLVWAGSARRTDPDARAIDRRRSITLAHFAPLATVQGVSFVSLQKDEPARQTLAPPPGMTVIDVTTELNDFADTAALIGALDLVISVDTAVAHLAGTLGKPVWILTQFDSCWRWLVGRTDSPWYPSARLFRQPVLGDWDAVIGDVVTALSGFAPPR